MVSHGETGRGISGEYRKGISGKYDRGIRVNMQNPVKKTKIMSHDDDTDIVFHESRA